MTPNPSKILYIEARLSGWENDVEIIAGTANDLLPIITGLEAKKLPYRYIDAEEAVKLLNKEPNSVGCGVFIPHNLLVTETNAREVESQELLIYLAVRLGVGSIYSPKELVINKTRG